MTSTAQTLKKTDSVSVHIGMDEAKRAKVARELSGFLASSFMLYTKTLYYHWNVTGQNFVGLHTLFESQYKALQLAADTLAERVRALGHFTPGTVKEFSAMSEIEDDRQLPASAMQMVKNLLLAHETCSRQAREVFKVAEDAEDEVTMDMLVDRMTFHDGAAWMLRAITE